VIQQAITRNACLWIYPGRINGFNTVHIKAAVLLLALQLQTDHKRAPPRPLILKALALQLAKGGNDFERGLNAQCLVMI
jgi:hypothetical protein